MNILIIGYGSIGKRHAEVLCHIDSNYNIEYVTKQLDLPYKSFKNIDDIEDLSFYDYFIIASITSVHLSQLQYIDKRVEGKIILVEKPLSTKFTDITCKNRVYVAYNLRFHPLMAILKDKINNEKVLSINIQAGQYLPSWRIGRSYKESYSASIDQGGGVLLDLSHELDYLLWLFGSVESIQSFNSKISDLDIDSDDIAIGIGVMNSGAIFNFSMDYISKIPLRRVLVNTINNTYVADFVNNTFQDSDKSCILNTQYLKDIDRNDSYIAMHREIIENSTHNNLSTLSDGLKVLKIIDLIRRI